MILFHVQVTYHKNTIFKLCMNTFSTIQIFKIFITLETLSYRSILMSSFYYKCTSVDLTIYVHVNITISGYFFFHSAWVWKFGLIYESIKASNYRAKASGVPGQSVQWESSDKSALTRDGFEKKRP